VVPEREEEPAPGRARAPSRAQIAPSARCSGERTHATRSSGQPRERKSRPDPKNGAAGVQAAGMARGEVGRRGRMPSLRELEAAAAMDPDAPFRPTESPIRCIRTHVEPGGRPVFRERASVRVNTVSAGVDRNASARRRAGPFVRPLAMGANLAGSSRSQPEVPSMGASCRASSPLSALSALAPTKEKDQLS
jgi:hypothetical protein